MCFKTLGENEKRVLLTKLQIQLQYMENMIATESAQGIPWECMMEHILMGELYRMMKLSVKQLQFEIIHENASSDSRLMDFIEGHEQQFIDPTNGKIVCYIDATLLKAAIRDGSLRVGGEQESNQEDESNG